MRQFFAAINVEVSKGRPESMPVYQDVLEVSW